MVIIKYMQEVKVSSRRQHHQGLLVTPHSLHQQLGDNYLCSNKFKGPLSNSLLLISLLAPNFQDNYHRHILGNNYKLGNVHVQRQREKNYSSILLV